MAAILASHGFINGAELMDDPFELTDAGFEIIMIPCFDRSTPEFGHMAITLGISCIWNEFWTFFDNHNHSFYEEHAVFFPSIRCARGVCPNRLWHHNSRL
ncbi:MAG: hypothetical protein AAF554_06945 [Bacteroidota bacterium]